MAPAATAIGLDLSCAAETPMTGVGYAALYQVQALAQSHPEFAIHVFATGDRSAAEVLHGKVPRAVSESIHGRNRLLKYYAWTRLSWPPIEWFTGPVTIAHNLCHQTPAAKKAVRLVTVHDLSCYRVPETHTPRNVDVQKTLIDQCAREADHIVTVSDHCKRELVEILNVPESRITTVHNGVNLAEFEGDLDATLLASVRDRFGIVGPYFIHLGTIEPRKNLERLIAAYAALRDRHADLPQLVLAGKRGWKSEPIFDAIAKHNRGNSIVHAGYLSRAEAVALLKGAQACLYPSLYEGFGLPVLEAMAAATPVMTSTSSSLPEVGGEAVIYTDPTDIDAMAAGIETVWHDETGNRARVQLGLARAQSLTWQASAADLARLYHALAS